MVDDIEGKCAADTMMSILNGDKNMANSMIVTTSTVVTTEATSSAVGLEGQWEQPISHKNQALLPFVCQSNLVRLSP